jgi:dihydroorotate dehydrogenase
VDDVWTRLRAGATLVQLYSAFIYEGPLLPHRLHEGLQTRLRATGLTSLGQIIGADA